MTIIHPSPELIHNNLINTLECFWDVKLPKSYKDFILSTNGGTPDKKIFFMSNGEEGSVKSFFGIIADYSYGLLERIKMFSERIPKNMLPIANDSGGNLILLSVRGADYGRLYFWDHNWEAEEGKEPAYSNLTLVADSFNEFINSLKDESEIEGLA
jgi:hypothetical protein